MSEIKLEGTVTFSDGVMVKVKLTIKIIGQEPIIIGRIEQAEPDDIPPHKIGDCIINLSNHEIYTRPKATTFQPDDPSP